MNQVTGNIGSGNAVMGALKRQRMMLSIVLLLSVAGVAAWFGMNRQEDPAFPYRGGFVQVAWPGASVEQIERLVVNPLEEELTQVEEIREIRTTMRSGFALVTVELKETVYDTETAWDRVRTAVGQAEPQFPLGVGKPLVDDRQTDASTVVLALTGSDDLVALQQAAERLKKRLFALDAVARVRIYGDSGEQVTIRYDQHQAMALGLSPQAVAAQLRERNRIVPAGHLDQGGRQLLLLPDNEFTSLGELRRTPIRLPGGGSMPLELIASVDLEVSDPQREMLWVNGRRGVAVAVVISDNVTNAVHFGQRLRQMIDELRGEFAPLQIEEMFFQPDRVKARLQELGRSLLLGVLIVAGLLFAFMGLRMGLVVALIVPLVAMSSLALYAIGGGVLHQISVAGMVIALGMLVDNAIVMVENIQWHLDRGASKMEAAVSSVSELAGPLAAATGTTLAVFIPMLISRGNTADFTRAIPIMIILMLLISFFYALFVSPLVGQRVLIARPRGKGRSRMAEWGRSIGGLAVRRGRWVLAFTAVLVISTVYLGGFLDRDFFPTTDRNQLVVDIIHPEGTPIDSTAALVSRLAGTFQQAVGVEQVFSFAGSSGPRFYYNLSEKPRSPHIGRVVLQSTHQRDLPGLIREVRAFAVRHPEAQIVTHQLAQGPPTEAPVEFELTGERREDLIAAAEQLTGLLRQIDGTADVRHNQGIGIPGLRFSVLDAVAESNGLDRTTLAQGLAMQTQGLEIGQYRGSDDPLPILLKTYRTGRQNTDALSATSVFTANGTAVPAGQFSRESAQWQPAVFHHYNLQPSIKVLSELERDVTYATVYQQLLQHLEASPLRPGVEMHAGGLQESSGDANTALYRTLPVGLGLLLLFLLWQFNSFRRVGIVLITVPLAITGVVPGLLITGYSFGFMALLGVVALVGIVVNNAIVLVDLVDRNLYGGQSKAEAVMEAVARRTRPILLTTLTTVAGLLPLTLAESTLWPPMAWSIISGLIASTVLTLGVVPVLCYWMLERPPKRYVAESFSS